MKKTATKATPVSLGTKRTCPKCTSKFYDFEKDPIQCPKCHTQVDPEAELQLFKKPSESKKKKEIRDEDEVVVATSDDAFESVDDLGDDDESLEDLADAEGDGDDD